MKAAGNVVDVSNPEGLVNGTIDTNLGLFRAYMKMYLNANPHVAHDSVCFRSDTRNSSGLRLTTVSASRFMASASPRDIPFPLPAPSVEIISKHPDAQSSNIIPEGLKRPPISSRVITIRLPPSHIA